MNSEQLQKNIRYHFGDPSVLRQALTHKSYGHEFSQQKPPALRDNERLEFLGDAVLEIVISDLLLETFPQANEGQLSKMRAAMVNQKTLAQLAQSIHLPDCIRLGKGELQTHGHGKASIVASAFEALIAAIYLDGGFQAVYACVRHLFGHLLKEKQDPIVFLDYKTQLQEMIQARWKVIPSYHILEVQGPDHAKIFQIEVKLQDQTLAVATGSSKKNAEQNAARAAIHFVENRF